MTTTLRIINNEKEAQILFLANTEFSNILEIKMEDLDKKNFVSLHIQKQQAKQIIFLLQNQFNL